MSITEKESVIKCRLFGIRYLTVSYRSTNFPLTVKKLQMKKLYAFSFLCPFFLLHLSAQVWEGQSAGFSETVTVFDVGVAGAGNIWPGSFKGDFFRRWLGHDTFQPPLKIHGRWSGLDRDNGPCPSRQYGGFQYQCPQWGYGLGFRAELGRAGNGHENARWWCYLDRTTGNGHLHQFCTLLGRAGGCGRR